MSATRGRAECKEASNRHQTCRFDTGKPWLDLQFSKDRNNILKPDQLESMMKRPTREFDADVLDRIHGSLVGMALGDAVGAHVEFRPRTYMIDNPVSDLKGGGTWGLNKGEFTDDTSMALCLAISLIVRKYYEPYDQLVRYKWWFEYGYMSSTGHCFDIGAATKNSLLEFKRRQSTFAKKHNIPLEDLDYLLDPGLLKEFDVNCSNPGVAGNGALMRLAPVPLFFYKNPMAAVEYSGLSGLITHGDDKSRDACRYYGGLIVAAVNGVKKDELLSENFYKNSKWFGNQALHVDIINIARGSYKRDGGYEKGIRGKGYVVDALEAALWAFWSDKDSFREGVLAAVNLGDDTDTTAAIYGQLAGAYYGYKKLPQNWKEALFAKGFILCLSEWIVYEGTRWAQKGVEHSHIPTPVVDVPNDPQETEDNKSSMLDTKKTPYSTSIIKKLKDPSTLDIRDEQLSDNDNSSRRRSKSFNSSPEILGGNLNGRLQMISKKSADNKYQSLAQQKIYILDAMSSVNDVRKWLKSLHKQVECYADLFKQKGVDGYWLLNHVDKKLLIDYGVNDEEHRRIILEGIQELRSRCPVRFSESPN